MYSKNKSLDFMIHAYLFYARELAQLRVKIFIYLFLCVYYYVQGQWNSNWYITGT